MLAHGERSGVGASVTSGLVSSVPVTVAVYVSVTPGAALHPTLLTSEARKNPAQGGGDHGASGACVAVTSDHCRGHLRWTWSHC